MTAHRTGLARTGRRPGLGVEQHREAILDAWHAGLTVTAISDALTSNGAEGCGRASVHQLVMRARAEGDERAAPHPVVTDAYRAKLSAARRARADVQAKAARGGKRIRK